MKQFFKFVFASTLGVFLAFFLVVVFFALIGAATGGGKTKITKNTVLEINMASFIPEKTGNIEVSPFSGETGDNLGLQRIKKIIAHAAEDKKVSGILIKTQGVSSGFATLSEVREAIDKFKESGKFVYAYSDMYSQGAYYLASVADSIYLNPNGMIDIKGFAAMIPFYKDGLDKLGVKMNVFYAGDFKSATEPYRRTEMSEPNRIQTKEFLESILSQFQKDIAESRGIEIERIDEIMTNYKGKTAESSLDAGLIDEIVYWDEVESKLRSRMGLKKDKKLKIKSLSKYDSGITLKSNSSKKKKIAVLVAEGTINYGTDNKGEVSEEKYVKILNKIRKDDDIKALVLRVNSGGGSSITSDIIWREIERIKESGKPVIASFGDYAASGGYYIAAGADTIVAEPNTLTGSIGVFMMMPNVTELLNEKLGISYDDVRTHPMAVNMSPMQDVSDQEAAIFQELTDQIYDQFLQRVADGRKMTKEEVHKVAQGRVWTGNKAIELGLVDVLGGLEEAIEIAASAAGIEEYSTPMYPTIETSFIEEMIKNFNSTDVSAEVALSAKELEVLSYYKNLKSIVSDRTPQARLPLQIVFE